MDTLDRDPLVAKAATAPFARASQTAATDAQPLEAAERRRSPRRRLRDRIASLDSTANPTLRAHHDVRNLSMLCDDDLRQTALSLAAVEKYLHASMQLLEDPSVAPLRLRAHAESEAVESALAELTDNVDELRRRMLGIALALGQASGRTERLATHAEHQAVP